ncbi:MAG: amino acid adenylation domain-containing protein, partial [bacterium]|nr:amino acid adenylation domain-containing protein [bacterium]
MKLRGLRIELGEIEKVFSANPAIRQAVVVFETHQSGAPYICAYYTLEKIKTGEKQRKQNASQFKKYLEHRLPDYMVPAYLLELEAIPLTPGKKIDRQALPKPHMRDTGENIIAPETPLQEKLREIWTGVLSYEKNKIGIDTNFFNLGGQSLKATIVLGRIHKKLEVNVSLAQLFRTPTIRGLAKFIESTAAEQFKAIKKAVEKPYYALSSAQKRLYILYRLDPTVTVYHMPAAVMLEGELDRKRLEKTIRALIRRHESCRTSFEEIEGEPVQRIHPEVPFSIEYIKTAPGEENKEPGTDPLDAARRKVDEFIRPFELSRPPLLRVGLMEISPTINVFIADMHHIIADGVSMDIFIKDFMAHYEGKEQPPLKLQYRDFSEWQNAMTQTGEMRKKEEYWLKEFQPGEEHPVLELPYDNPGPRRQSFQGDAIHFTLSKNHAKQLKQLAKERGTTLYISLLAILNVYLSKLSGGEDIVVGSPVTGRHHDDLQGIIGMFVNTLPLRNYPSREKKFTHLLEEVKEQFLEAMENQDYHYEELVEKVVQIRDLSRNPLFDVMLVLQNLEIRQLKITGLELRPFQYENNEAKFDLAFNATEIEDELHIEASYCTALFKKETMQRMIAYFEQTVASVLENPGQICSEIEIIPGKELEKLLYHFNDTTADYPKTETLHGLFAEQAEKTPENTAVTICRDETGLCLRGPSGGQGGTGTPIALRANTITYGDLNREAEQLALELREKGVRPDTIVAMQIEPSIETAVGIMGILKAGGAYMPINPQDPAERKKHLVENSGTKIMVKTRKSTLTTENRNGENKEEENKEEENKEEENREEENREQQEEKRLEETLEIVYLESWHKEESQGKGPEDREATGMKAPVKEFIQQDSAPSNLAYVIHTSGTTGQPKGVLVEHRGVVNYTTWRCGYYRVTENDRALQLLSYYFDGFVSNFYTTLHTGGTLVMVPEEKRMDYVYIKDQVKQKQVTNVLLVPGMYRMLLEAAETADLDTLRFVVLGGEKSDDNLIEKSRQKAPKTVLYNEYGPTEASVTAIAGAQLLKTGSAKIGKPIANTRIYIVDKALKPVPTCVTGEIYIAGTGLARSYLNNPELTTEKFVQLQTLLTTNKPDKQTGRAIPEERLYKTGDLGRWQSDGTIEFRGRSDTQMKIRGYRIEPGEIETQLTKHPSIEAAVVTVKEGTDYLCAYIVPVNGKNHTAPGPDLKKHLSRILPEYMIPTHYTTLDRLPLNSIGKINLKALPEPGIAADGDYVAPRNDIEAKLAAIWKEILFAGSKGDDAKDTKGEDTK